MDCPNCDGNGACPECFGEVTEEGCDICCDTGECPECDGSGEVEDE